jgi:hypothetical protein
MGPALALASGVFGAIGLAVLLTRSRKAESCRAEFLRRSGVADDRAAASAVVMLQGRSLPRGGTRAVWVTIATNPASGGKLVYASAPHENSWSLRVPGAGEGALTPTAAADVTAALAAVTNCTERPVLSGVRDGFPFEFLVRRSGDDRVWWYSGNLAAWNWPDDPVCRLADAVLRAAEAAGAKPELFGACSSDGQVTPGDR